MLVFIYSEMDSYVLAVTNAHPSTVSQSLDEAAMHWNASRWSSTNTDLNGCVASEKSRISEDLSQRSSYPQHFDRIPSLLWPFWVQGHLLWDTSSNAWHKGHWSEQWAGLSSMTGHNQLTAVSLTPLVYIIMPFIYSLSNSVWEKTPNRITLLFIYNTETHNNRSQMVSTRIMSCLVSK